MSIFPLILLDYGLVTIVDQKNGSKRGTIKAVKRVPIYDYLLSGMNDVTKQALTSLIEIYLHWFDEQVVAIHEGREWNKKIFYPIFILSLLIYKFPELVPFILSHKITLAKYSFPAYFKVNKLPSAEINFFEFIIRVNFYYFPSFIFIHEFVCYNSRQPLAIRINSQTVLMHELFARFFLEEILKVLKEDIQENPESFYSNPDSIRKWGLYPTIAFHIFAMCSYKERTYIPIIIFEKYTLFILECVAIWRKNKPNGYYELVNPLFRLLQELAHFSLLQGIRVRLQKIENDLPQREWSWIQDYKKCMKLVKFLGKKGRDMFQNQGSEKRDDLQKTKEKNKTGKTAKKGFENEMNIEVEGEGNEQDNQETQFEKEIPYLEKNLWDIATEEIEEYPVFESNYDTNTKKCIIFVIIVS